MLTFIQHFSSSMGNLYEIKSAEGRLLIECGVSWKKLTLALDFDLAGIHGCILTHFHKDHSHCFEKLVGHSVPVYATQETFDVLPLVARPRMLKPIVPDQQFMVGPFEVTPFETHHDAEGSCGFVIEQGNDSLLFCTDSTHISEQFMELNHGKQVPKRFTHIAIECSWDRERVDEGLMAGKINQFYADRLTRTHMEVSHTLLYLQEYCDMSRCREIHLIHLSSTLDKESVRARFEEEFMLPVFIKE